MKSTFSFLVLTGLFLGLDLSASAQASATKPPLVCFFKQTNFTGAHFCFRPGQKPPNLDHFPLSDGSYSDGSFGSIRVDGGASAKAYDTPNYVTQDSGPLSITKSIPDLKVVYKGYIESVVVNE